MQWFGPKPTIFGFFWQVSVWQAYTSGVTLFDLARPSIYYKKGQPCAHSELTFCATYRFDCRKVKVIKISLSGDRLRMWYVFGSTYAFHLMVEGLKVCPFFWSFLYDLNTICLYKALKALTLFSMTSRMWLMGRRARNSFTRRRRGEMRSSHSQQLWFITPDGSTN